ncbi:MAG: hypothetical protein ISS66_06745 [Desulfobacteraceae bacterium]|nr:hypothetical protein [Desulfobacteraceae bacterium]
MRGCGINNLHPHPDPLPQSLKEEGVYGWAIIGGCGPPGRRVTSKMDVEAREEKRLDIYKEPKQDGSM